MSDPPRLRSNAGSLEALLLQSAASCEPPPEVEDEVWRRVQVVTAAGAAVGAAGLAVQSAAAGSKIVKGALWLSVFKWSAVVAVGVPVAGVVGHWAVHRLARPSAVVASAVVTPRPVGVEGAVRPQAAPVDSAEVALTAPIVLSAPRPSTAASHVHPGAASSSPDAPSALWKESVSLGDARTKLAAGDPRGALDEVTRLGVEFPHGRLVQEREVLEMDSLSALGDIDAARARARAFLDRFPSSPYLAHVRQLAAR